jgi:hypothetical protein
MSKLFLSFILVLTIVIPGMSQSKTYYVSPEGKDNNNGFSKSASWKTIERVNQAKFQPGDSILFKAGGVWKGQLHPQGSGAAGKPIVINSYGGVEKPIINIGAAEGAGIELVNQSWWEIKNMEVTSGVPPKDGIGRQGIVALVKGQGHHVQHIVISNCYIHDIWGQLGGNTEYTGYKSCAIMVHKKDSIDGSLNDVLIENNRIERFDKVGIIVYGGRNNIVVRKNRMENLGGDGIIVAGSYKGLIEYNIAVRTCLRSGDPDLKGAENWWPHTAAIWIANAVETIMQFNEAYDTGRQPGNGDGFAYDFDFECKKCILQYNYSANGHGLLLIMNKTSDNIARYNISQNDQTHLVQIHGNTEDGNLIHNNVFYVDHSTVDLDFYCGMNDEKDKSKLGATFSNNIFYAAAQGRFRTVYSHGSALDRKFNDSLLLPPSADGPKFNRNCYFGPWLKALPNDKEPLLADPLFAAPGTGAVGLSTVTGYKLLNGSPCINAAAPIKTMNLRDFFNNPLKDNIVNIGAFEKNGL